VARVVSHQDFTAFSGEYPEVVSFVAGAGGDGMVSPVDDDGVVVFDDMGDVEGAVVGVEADELEALRGVAFEEIDFLVVGLEGRVVDVMAVGWSAGPVAGGAVGFADEHAGGGDVAVDDDDVVARVLQALGEQ